MADQVREVIEMIDRVNETLCALRMNPLAVVDPRTLKAQEVNARYMEQREYHRLLANIRQEGALESVPFCVRDAAGDFHIVSGHHRVKAAIEAGIERIVIMYKDGLDADAITSKQIAHNSLSGKDDPILLKELYESIKEINWKVASGLSSDIAQIQPIPLTLPHLDTKQFTLLFIPQDIEAIDEAVEKVSVLPKDVVRIAPVEYYNRWMEAMKRIKSVLNIKSTPVGFLVLVDLALERLEQIEETLKEREDAGMASEMSAS